MSLRQLAEQDLAITLEDGADGFGWPITLRDPSGNESAGLFGQTGDIHQVIDPDTGQAVSGRQAHVSLRMSSILADANISELPKVIQSPSAKPWLVVFEDLAGTPQTFRILETNPDRTLGLLTMHIEVWKS